MAKAAISPPTKVGFLKRLRSNIGSRWSASAATNATSRTVATTSEPTTVVDPQPSSLERISP